MKILTMVIGYNSFNDAEGVVLDIVDNDQIAETKKDSYYNKYNYVDFVECIKDNDIYLYDDKEYRILDQFIFEG